MKEYQRQNIINEINECREDERIAQNQLLQAVLIIVTVLGVILSASLFGGTDSENIYLISDIQRNQLLFYVSVCVFSVGYTYAISVGMQNALRFHYIRDMEDKLTEYYTSEGNKTVKKDATETENGESPLQNICDERELSPEVGWMNLYTAIATRNFTHLNSVYAKFYFVDFTLIYFFAVLFCIFTLVAQYMRIEPKSFVDYGMGVFSIVLFLIITCVFVSVCMRAEDMYKVSLKYAESRKRDRIRKNEISSSDSEAVCTSAKQDKNRKNDKKDAPQNIKKKNPKTKTCMLYFIYPKIKDIQKPVIIIIGFIVGLILRFEVRMEFNAGSDPSLIEKADIEVLIGVMIVIEFLVYQARYLWNDIRGAVQDWENGAIGRLPMQDMGAKNSVNTSLYIICVRLVLAVVAAVFFAKIRSLLLFGIISIVIISILYEGARSCRKNAAIYLLVCTGYPLRFVLGLGAANPQLFSFLKSLTVESLIALLFLIGAYGCMGEYTVLLEWTHEAVARHSKDSRRQKSYYAPLYNVLNKSNKHYVERKKKELQFISLRFPGRLQDWWNIAYIASVVCLSLSILFVDLSVERLLIEVILVALASVLCVCGNKWLNGLFVFELLLHIVKTVWIVALLGVQSLLFMICLHQIAFMCLYWFLRMWYDEEFNIRKLVKTILGFLYVLVIGKETFNFINKNEISGKS